MPPNPQADLINQLYQGKLKDYVRCLECGYESWRIDTYLDIPLVIRPFGASQAYGSVVCFFTLHLCQNFTYWHHIKAAMTSLLTANVNLVYDHSVIRSASKCTCNQFCCHRRRLCRHSSNQKLWMGPTSTSVNAAKRNVTPARWAHWKCDVGVVFIEYSGLLLTCLPLWYIPLCTGSEISAFSLPADTTAEAVWFRLYHYASHQAQWPHDFPRGAWHESFHWCGRWGMGQLKLDFFVPFLFYC